MSEDLISKTEEENPTLWGIKNGLLTEVNGHPVKILGDGTRLIIDSKTGDTITSYTLSLTLEPEKVKEAYKGPTMGTVEDLQKYIDSKRGVK